MANDIVKWSNATKGFGLVEPKTGGGDIFVHISAPERAGIAQPNGGQGRAGHHLRNRNRPRHRSCSGLRHGEAVRLTGASARRLRSPEVLFGMFRRAEHGCRKEAVGQDPRGAKDIPHGRPPQPWLA